MQCTRCRKYCATQNRSGRIRHHRLLIAITALPLSAALLVYSRPTAAAPFVYSTPCVAAAVLICAAVVAVLEIASAEALANFSVPLTPLETNCAPQKQFSLNT